MTKKDTEFCLTNLMDIIDICGKKHVTKLDMERIFTKAGCIYEIIDEYREDDAKKRRKTHASI